MIRDSSRYYGAVITRIVDHWGGSVSVRKMFDDYAGFYLLNSKLPIFIKYSTQRRGPWTFTFNREHQKRQQALFEVLDECLTVFVCGKDGIAALKHIDIRQILDEHFEDQESVTIRRRHNEMYKVRGRDGVLEKKVSRNSLIELLQPMQCKVAKNP